MESHGTIHVGIAINTEINKSDFIRFLSATGYNIFVWTKGAYAFSWNRASGLDTPYCEELLIYFIFLYGSS
jgi:hypothetical protein